MSRPSPLKPWEQANTAVPSTPGPPANDGSRAYGAQPIHISPLHQTAAQVAPGAPWPPAASATPAPYQPLPPPAAYATQPGMLQTPPTYYGAQPSAGAWPATADSAAYGSGYGRPYAGYARPYGGGYTSYMSPAYSGGMAPAYLSSYYSGGYGSGASDLAGGPPLPGPLGALHTLHLSVSSIAALMELVGMNADAVHHVFFSALSLLERVGVATGELLGFLHARPPTDAEGRPIVDPQQAKRLRNQKIARLLVGGLVLIASLSVLRRTFRSKSDAVSAAALAATAGAAAQSAHKAAATSGGTGRTRFQLGLMALSLLCGVGIGRGVADAAAAAEREGTAHAAQAGGELAHRPAEAELPQSLHDSTSNGFFSDSSHAQHPGWAASRPASGGGPPT